MVNAKFNTDEHLNEILNVDRHMDHHPGRHWLVEDDGWYNDSDDDEQYENEENLSDDSEESWDDPNRRDQILDKDGEDGENGTDDDNGFDTEEK